MSNELQNILDDIKLDKDTNLLPENLKAGVTCLGVNGTMTSGVDTTSTNPITSQDIANGKEGFVNGEKITGNVSTITNKYAFGVPLNENNVTVLGDQVLIDNTALSDMLIRKDCIVETGATQANVASAIGLTANKIKKGTEILGITGTYEGNIPFNLGTNQRVIDNLAVNDVIICRMLEYSINHGIEYWDLGKTDHNYFQISTKTVDNKNIIIQIASTPYNRPGFTIECDGRSSYTYINYDMVQAGLFDDYISSIPDEFGMISELPNGYMSSGWYTTDGYNDRGPALTSVTKDEVKEAYADLFNSNCTISSMHYYSTSDTTANKALRKAMADFIGIDIYVAQR